MRAEAEVAAERDADDEARDGAAAAHRQVDVVDRVGSRAVLLDGDAQQALVNYSKALELDRNQPTVAAKVATLSTSGPSPVIAGAPPAGGSPYSPR